MFITFFTKHTTNKQITFEDLIKNPNYLYQQQLYTKQVTIETTLPKKIPEIIAKHRPALMHLAAVFPLEFNYTEQEISAKYTTYKIPKKTKGFRTIHAPTEDLKFVQKTIVNTLQSFNILMHDSAHAYIKNRSPKTANEVHQKNNSNWFLHIDLKNFFDSCTKDFIYEQVSKIYPFCILKLDEECDIIIKQIINLACLNGVLPQGNPLSPYLTNLIMVPIDYQLNKLTPVYTRYSDDMLFSSRTKINTELIVNKIEEILKETPLKINHEKTRLGSKNGNNWNLGLMLNKDNNITVGHEKKRQYKAAIDQFLYDPAKYDTAAKQKLAGITSYYRHIEPAYFDYIIKQYNIKHQKNLLALLHNI